MGILMATAATEINSVGEPELSTNILATNQDNLSIPHSCEMTASCEPLSSMESLAISSYGQGNPFPVYTSSEIGEKDTLDESPFNGTLCSNRSLLEDNKLCNDNNNSSKLVEEDAKQLQPQMLLPENEQLCGTKNYVRQDSCTQTNEDRENSYQDVSDYYTDLNGKRYQKNINFTEQQCPDHVNFPYKFPDVPPRCQAWGKEKQIYLQKEGGYNSDSDILWKKSKNKRSSLDGPCGSYEKSPEFGPFEKGHRRVRSGDASMSYIATNNNGMHALGNMHQNARHSMPHSLSQGSLHAQMQLKLPPLNQSISVDCTSTGNTQIHEHLCLQSTTFVNLQAAIAQSTKEYEQLGKDVDSKLHELNVGLRVEHRTHEDCKLVEEEIKQLRKEIQAMYDRCDQSGVQVPGDPTGPRDNIPTSDLIYPGYPTSPVVSQVYPTSPSNPLRLAPVTPTRPSRLPVTVQPGQREESRESPCKNPAGGSQVSPDPPPIPPRQPMPIVTDMKPMNEYWQCPLCTFENLLVSNCEMCTTPRPCALRNNIQR